MIFFSGEVAQSRPPYPIPLGTYGASLKTPLKALYINETVSLREVVPPRLHICWLMAHLEH